MQKVKRNPPRTPRRKPNPATGKLVPYTAIVTDKDRAYLRSLPGHGDGSKLIRQLLKQHFETNKTDSHDH